MDENKPATNEPKAPIPIDPYPVFCVDVSISVSISDCILFISAIFLFAVLKTIRRTLFGLFLLLSLQHFQISGITRNNGHGPTRSTAVSHFLVFAPPLTAIAHCPPDTAYFDFITPRTS